MSRPELYIATYHYVRDLPRTHFPRIKGMLLDDFRQQAKLLPELFEMATLSSALEFLSGSYEPERNLCLMTFDDGLKEHYSEVTPILLEHGIQGVFFPITACMNGLVVAPVHMNHFLLAELGIERYRTVFTGALRSLGLDKYAEISVDHGTARMTYPLDTNEVAEFKYLFNFLLPSSQRDIVVRTLFSEWIGRESVFSTELYLSWDEAREMQRAGMVMGGHSHAHRPLATLSDHELACDLEECWSLMSSQLEPQELWPFSYPYGKANSFNAAVIETLQRLGFCCALCTESGRNLPGADRFGITRVDCKQIVPNRLETPLPA